MAEPKILNIKLAEYTPVSTVEKLSTTGWLQYGVRNDFPNYLAELSDSTAVHGVLCQRISDMIAGKGLTSNNQAIIDKYKLTDASNGCADDVKIQGGYFLKINYTTGGELFSIKHVPFAQCRLGMDKEDNVTGVWFSRDWSATNKAQNKPTFYPLFDASKKPSANSNYVGEACQFYYNFGKKNGVLQYPKPDYWGAINDIETIRQIGLYHSNTYLNGLFPSFIINFKNGIPADDKIAEIEGDFQRRLSGAKNTGKYIINFGESGTDTSPEITAFPMTEANTAYIELSSKQAMQNVFIGHSVTTPRLFGIADAGNGLSSNTDEMKQGLQIMLTQVIEPKQRMISDGLEKILAANGINIEIDFIPNTPIDLVDKTLEGDGADVASQALNGAQIASLIDVIVQAATGVLPVDSAKAVIQASFPTLTQTQIDNIFSGVVAGSVDPNEVALNALKIVMSSLQKKRLLRS